VVFTLAGLWPYTRPTDAVATVLAEAGMPPARESIGTSLREILVRQLIGTLALAEDERWDAGGMCSWSGVRFLR
jgi:hypothetical protein